jgi:hypothetical protein
MSRFGTMLKRRPPALLMALGIALALALGAQLESAGLWAAF